MYTRNSVLTEKLRRLSDGLRGVCDGAGIKDHTCSELLDEAAAEKTQAADQEATDSEKENVEQEETQAADGTLVLYVCDRLACAKCNINCSHTTDVRHALRFNGYNFLFDVVVREAAEHADDR